MTNADDQSPLGRPAVVAFALTTASIVIMQIVLSRLFTATIGYYYAFMLVSLAMLGLGSGALIVRLWPRFFQLERLEVQGFWLSLAMSILAVAGTLLMLRIYPRLAVDRSVWALGGIFWCFFPTFLAGGILVSLVLCHARRRFHVYYAVDLISSAIGCLVAIATLAALSPSAAMLGAVAVLPALAALLFSLAGRRRGLAAIGLLVAGGLGLLSTQLERWPALTNPRHLDWLHRRPVLSEWNSVSNVTVFRGPFFTWSLSPAYRGPTFPMLDLLIDGVGGTEVVGFDGDPPSLARYTYLDHDLTSLGQQLVPPSGRQLIIGPGGGVDLLQAVRRGRREITAVEINPLVVRVVNQDLARFSGRPYRLPGVTVHLQNGRTFIKRTREAWDLISLTWVDTGGSAGSMAFSENYLYTVEAYAEFLDHLRPDGYFAFMRALGVGERLRVDTLRGVSVAAEALRRRGVQRPGRHLLVMGAVSPYFRARPMCYVLVKKSPFTAGETEAARRFASQLRFQPIWMPDGREPLTSMPRPYDAVAPTIHALIAAHDRERVYAEAPYDVAPTTDDNPFYFIERAGPSRPAGRAIRELGWCLAILLAVAVPFLGAPAFSALRRGKRLERAGLAAVAYFALLGFAFMLIEIELFQVFALVLGSPTHALGVVLASLLVFSGLGSLQGERLARARPHVLAAVFVALLALLALFSASKGWILSSLIGLSLPWRILGTAATIAPMAFLMGLPMSTGMALIHRADLLLWGWTANGICSVLASVLAIYLAIHVGIAMTFAAGIACYGVAAVLIQVMRRIPSRHQDS